MAPKTTLTWRDVLENQRIHFAACIQHGVPAFKLHKLQPDIKEWILCGKATVADCEHMDPWRPNPFTDLGCNLGDLILYRRVLPPKLLIDSGVTFQYMHDRYGLTVELMGLLKYSTEDWIQLEIEEAFLSQLTDEQWTRLFGLTSQNELLAQVRRRQSGSRLQQQHRPPAPVPV